MVKNVKYNKTNNNSVLGQRTSSRSPTVTLLQHPEVARLLPVEFQVAQSAELYQLGVGGFKTMLTNKASSRSEQTETLGIG